jgi:hypothetical protein
MPKAAAPVPCRDKWRIRGIDHEGKRQSDVYASYREAARELRRRQVETDEIKRGLRRAPSVGSRGKGPTEMVADYTKRWLDAPEG